MSTSELGAGDRISDVRFTIDTMSVDLEDGRTITVPLVSYPKLLHASPEDRERWQLSGAGYGLHWPDLDEDLSVEGMLRGAPSVGAKTPGAGDRA